MKTEIRLSLKKMILEYAQPENQMTDLIERKLKACQFKPINTVPYSEEIQSLKAQLAEHKEYCCCAKKVKLRAIIEYETEVPAHWDKDMIEFSYNDGCWCADNIVNELQSYIDYLNNQGDCLCFGNKCKIELIGD